MSKEVKYKPNKNYPKWLNEKCERAFRFRKEKGVKEVLKNGWSQAECYNIDYEFLSWVIPRLKKFSTHKMMGIPSIDNLTLTKWKKIVNTMLSGFEKAYNNYFETPKKFDKELQVSLQLFTKYFYYLWL